LARKFQNAKSVDKSNGRYVGCCGAQVAFTARMKTTSGCKSIEKARKGGTNVESREKRQDRPVCGDLVREETPQYDCRVRDEERFESKTTCAVSTITCLAAEISVQSARAAVRSARARVQLSKAARNGSALVPNNPIQSKEKL
jgi:hypothetical protein